MPRTNREVLRAGGKEAESLSGLEEAQLGEPYMGNGSFNLLSALSNATQGEERSPSNPGPKLIAYLERRIRQLEFRAADLEAAP